MRHAMPVSVALVIFAAGATSQGQTIVRGPYLQLGTPTGIVVRWRTDVPTDSRVLYGPSAMNLGSSVVDPALVTEHVVTLGGLSPDTRHFYAVGTSSLVLAGGDAGHFFDTHPVPGARKPTRIWVLGDSGVATSDSRKVRDAYYAFTGTRHTDLWMMLGDNAYVDGTDAEFQAGVFVNKYEAMLRKSVLWPTLGNHDGHTANSATQTGPYYEIFTLPTGGEAGGVPSGTEAYYSFDYANVHFVCLDSYETDNTPGSPMLTWLAADLAATTQEWRVTFWHHAPYTKGSHNSDTDPELIAMRQNVVPILEAHGVDLVLCGHSHSYERTPLIDGHYGLSTTFGPANVLGVGDGELGAGGAYKKPLPPQTPHAGTVYVVAGTSGSVAANMPLDHPAMITAFAVMGSLVIDVDGDQLDLRFISKEGLVLDDFTMVKGPPTPVERTRVFVLPGATFKYHDLGIDLGAAWRAPAFDDSAWPSGPAPLGYGEGYIATTVSFGNASNKYPTTYFRTTFAPSFDVALVESLRFWANYDDGFVAWLNGQEVARSPNMPAGPIGYSTLATNHEAGAWELFGLPAGALLQGTNVLAIEVHQTNATSSDLVIDVAVDGDAFVPFLTPAAFGNGGPGGAPADVLLLNGSGGGIGRSIDYRWTDSLSLTVLPPPPAGAANFLLFGSFGTPGPLDAIELPFGIGPMCFLPSVFAPGAPDLFFLATSFAPDPAAVLFATPAPWMFTFPPPSLPGLVATLQGVITDSTGGIRVTNAVRLSVVP